MSKLTKQIHIILLSSFRGRAVTNCISSIHVFNKEETLRVKQKQNVQKNKEYIFFLFAKLFYEILSSGFMRFSTQTVK